MVGYSRPIRLGQPPGNKGVVLELRRRRYGNERVGRDEERHESCLRWKRPFVTERGTGPQYKRGL